MLAVLTSKIGLSAIKYGAIVLALLGLLAWGYHYKVSARDATAQLATVQADDARNAAALNTLQAQYASYQAAQQRLALEAQIQAANTATITKEIDSAPKTFECAKSPAIAALLGGLRTAASASKHPAPRAAR